MPLLLGKTLIAGECRHVFTQEEAPMVRKKEIPGVVSETLSLAEFAIRLGVSVTTCYELAARDELPVKALRIGRTYRFPRAQVDRLLGIESDAHGSTAA